MRPIDEYFLKHAEPIKSCLQFMRDHILGFNEHITEVWHYGMPFYYYKDKRLCYLWVHKKLQQPYLGIVDGKLIEHSELLLEKRARMKILLINPLEIDIATVDEILRLAISLFA
ncbi:DUF1801 domain-containing protein [Mucilaginibacter sp. HMF5004]|uniref:DUF1801 domain-containing protein n=1 Tax=Mucilaginibacter rivuli TaxID=2857527 RepID=UPI001C5CC4E5|nr:DUF1801 domain-containing protein [Mucilaginibacter rivuli]MBW4888868.1 DUF1801 domain-containing protein [Mucilaginibacter rivuli]